MLHPSVAAEFREGGGGAARKATEGNDPKISIILIDGSVTDQLHKSYVLLKH